MIPFVNLAAQHFEIEEKLNATFTAVLRASNLIAGEQLREFENEFAAYCGVKHCVGVGNGLDALALTLRAKNIGPGDEVIVPASTFIATWLSVSMVGAKIVPVTVDPDTVLLSPAALEKTINEKTAAIIPVHLYGQPVEMGPIMEIADARNIFVLEDAAQAHGALYEGKRAGSLGHAAAFSFYPTKNLGALGDGGAVVTDDDKLAASLRQLRNYGSSVKYVHQTQGVNSRLDELHAAFLRVKLPLLDRQNEQRRQIAAIYDAELAGVGDVKLTKARADCSHVYHLYVIRTSNREALVEHLRASGVGTAVHYPIAPADQAAYADDGFTSDQTSTDVANTCLSLPMWPGMTRDQALKVCASVKSFFNKT